MIQYCKCGWPVYGENVVRFKCPQCKHVVELISDAPQEPFSGELPRWVRFVKRLRKSTDTGVGDTVQRIAAKFGGERFKKFAQRIGLPCGCTKRQSEWNRLYPYGE